MNNKFYKILSLIILVVMVGTCVISCGRKPFTVEFYDGDELYAVVETDGKKIAMPDEPENTLGIFEGWEVISEMQKGSFFTPQSMNGKMFRKDFTVKVRAKFTEVVKLSFVTFSDEKFNDKLIIKDKAIEVLPSPIPPKEKIFIDWFTSPNFEINSRVREGTTFNADQTLYASYAGKTVTVTFKYNLEKYSLQRVEDKVITLDRGTDYGCENPDFTVDGYIFSGWCYDEQLEHYAGISHIDHDTVFYAKWKAVN